MKVVGFERDNALHLGVDAVSVHVSFGVAEEIDFGLVQHLRKLTVTSTTTIMVTITKARIVALSCILSLVTITVSLNCMLPLVWHR